MRECVGGVFAERGVVTDSLGVQQTSVGLKADLAKSRKIFQAPPNGEVVGVVDRGLGPKGLALLVVLLDAASLVVDVQGRSDSLGDHPRPEASRRPGIPSASGDPLPPAPPPPVAIFSEHL